MVSSTQSFQVRRTCTRKYGNKDEQGSFPLESFRNLPSYVLLGDPGAGKTEAFKREAEESGGKYIKARDFVIFDPKVEFKDKVLFIDALDEMRVNGSDNRTPLDHIRKQLNNVRNLGFRLSCREADWLGESDRTALMLVSPNREVVTLHLDPLTNSDIIEILSKKESISNPVEFINKARNNGLEEMLHNPQTLNLLVEAVEENSWPHSRSEIYELACRQLTCEKNPEHRAARHHKLIPPSDKLLDSAGYLCAICLLSGNAGLALEEDATDNQHFDWRELTTDDLPLLEVLKTNLFKSDSENQNVPIHRSVAEYLGARYLSNLIEKNGLPFNRVLALATGNDGGIITDLRGLMAWVSVHCRTSRSVLIERDPLGVILYGDVRNFSAEDKQLVLIALKRTAYQYPWFRSDDWSSSPWGALGTRDMISVFSSILLSPSREEADQALLDCVLDAIRHGEPMPSFFDSLESICRDTSYWPKIRYNAVQAYLHAMSKDNRNSFHLLDDVIKGIVEDNEDEILGYLLSKFYPDYISPAQIFDYLHPPKNDHLIGGYFGFWHHKLTNLTTDDNLPELLDQLSQRHKKISKLPREHQFQTMVGEILTRGLVVHGDKITDEKLYNWLGVGLDKHEFSIFLDSQHIECITSWFNERPNRYKAIIEHGAHLCTNKEDVRYCMGQCTTRLYHSPPPNGIENWYLDKAKTSQQNELAEYYFQRAVQILIREGKKEYLTLPKLEFIESWVDAHPNFQQWLEPFITCSIEHWQREQYLREQKYDCELQQKRNNWIDYYRQHLIAIRDGSAQPKIFYDLARAYDGQFYEARGETPHECLISFFDGDLDLVNATYSGFRHILDREDLPTVNEIVDIDLKGEYHYIRLPCLMAINELHKTKPSTLLQFDNALLSRLLAFRFTYNAGENPEWENTLIQQRPELAADVLVAYAIPLLHAGKEHVSGLYPLAENDLYSGVAKIVLPKLLESFPLRARKPQLINALRPLLKGAIHYLDKDILSSLVAKKSESKNMDIAQRVYWLACGVAIASSKYAGKLQQCLVTSKVRRRIFAKFLHSNGNRCFPYSTLPETTLSLVIELLAPDCLSERHKREDWVTLEMYIADIVRSFINSLGCIPNEIATKEIERLLTLSNLSHWHNSLRHALHNQRIAQRKAMFRHLSVKDIKSTLANLQPINAADLVALTYDHLCDITKKIRDSNTNDYKLYWNYEVKYKKLINTKSKPEDDCRDVLLSNLKERLGKLGIDAQREGSYADDKRADIRISFGGANGFNIPIEIKKDSHKDVWNAIYSQLIPKYTRDPGVNGYGIYLVFWFGGIGMKSPSEGKKPSNASELEIFLRQKLNPEDEHLIQICVIDCALPEVLVV